MNKGIYCGFVLLILLLIPYIIGILSLNDYEDDEFYKSTIKIAKGEFVDLSYGSVHYVLEGPLHGDLVIFTHGISSSSRVMRHISEPLIKHGYRTLRFDLYCRGHSSCPDTLYSEHLFVNQTEELLLKLEEKKLISEGQKIHFFGHSLGGGIAVSYCVRFPSRIKSLLLMAPAGLPLPMPFTASLATLPVISQIFKHTPIGRVIMEKRVPRAFTNPEKYIGEMEDLSMQLYFQFTVDGFFDAFLSTLINFSGLLSNNLVHAYEQVGKMDFPVVVFWGKDDHTVPSASAELVKEIIPRAEMNLFDDCGHIPQVEKKEELLILVTEFLTKQQKSKTSTSQL